MRRPPVAKGRIGAAIQEQCDHRRIIAFGGNVQRRFSCFGSRRDKIGLRGQHLANRVDVARTNRVEEFEWRRLRGI